MEDFGKKDTENFNPYHYKRYDDLPEEVKRLYMKINEDGDFITVKAYEKWRQYEKRAGEFNDFGRALFEKLFGVGKLTPEDLARIEADYGNSVKERKEEAQLPS